MLSKKLWASRQVIQQQAGPEVRKLLLDAWLLEAQQCQRLGTVSMLYSVLPWEQYGHLGAGIMLLYTSHLFGSQGERDKCLSSVNVSEEELLELVCLGCRMLKMQRLPEITPEVRKLLDRIVSSPYFNAEQPGGLVLDCLDDMLAQKQPDKLREMLQALRGELKGIYTPTEESSVFGYLSWEQVKTGALTSLGNRNMGRIHAKVIAKGMINVEKKVGQLKGSWSVCLAEMNSSDFVKHLLSTRPTKSTVPHSHAVLDCIEHTWLWMLASDMNVYSTVPNAPYSKLKECDEGVMYRRSERDVLPREVEKTLRRMAIEAYLAGAPELKVEACDNPMILRALQDEKKSYLFRGFRESCFPPENNPWVARDPQDLDVRAKMSCWLWDWDFRGLHLHHELLRKGGVDDEELEDDECLDTVEFFENNSTFNFDSRRRFLVPETISPLDPDVRRCAPDLVIPPGRREKIRTLLSGQATTKYEGPGLEKNSEVF